MKKYLPLLVWSLLIVPVGAQRNLTDIPVPDPELERQTFQVADGFEVNLYAADPLLAKPIQMNFDPQGRLWVASSETYPQIMPGQKANDKIIILEDLDGDGRAEKTRVFADGLLIPTGIEPGDGGAYVGASTELLHLKDTDGDGKADERRVLLSGFGTEDTHHIIHTLRWGYDGCLYFCQSIYIHSHIETPHGVRRLNGGGIWRFRPETMQLDVLAKGLINPWGFHFDRWGQLFATDGAGGEGINYIFPGAVFPTSPGAQRVLHGMNPGSPKFCGLEIVSGRHLPDDWQGDCITHDFRGHRVCRFKLSEAGSSYTAREMPELIKSSHVAFRPIDVKMGPDGAIYIADWYNPIIQHGEVDFRDPRRDHTHGRIWRVSRKDRPLVKRPQLVGASVDTLLEALKAPEQWTRQQAKRVLQEQHRDAIVERLGNAPFANADLDTLEQAWAVESATGLASAQLAVLQKADEPRLRAATVRLDEQAALVAVQDKHPRVRLSALHAIRRSPSLTGLKAALQVLDQPRDESLDFALWSLLRENKELWLPTLSQQENVSHMAYALGVVDGAEAAQAAGLLISQRQVSLEALQALARIMGNSASPELLATYLTAVLKYREQDAEGTARVLDALGESLAARRTRPAGDLKGVIDLIPASHEQLAGAALRLARVWRLEEAATSTITLAQSTSVSRELRSAAIAALSQLRSSSVNEAIQKLAANDSDTIVQVQALAALVELDPQRAAQTLVAVAEQLGTTDVSPVIEKFLERKDAPAKLVAELASAKLPTDFAKRAIRTANSSAKPLPDLIAALRKAGGISGQPLALTPEQMTQLVAAIKERGDAARGEQVFRRADNVCFKCHAIGGAGGQVGPDLTSLGGSAQVDYLVESMLEPSKKIKENYHSVVVQTTDGRLLTGVKVRQTDRDLILRNAEDLEVIVPLKSIEEQAPGQSLMPVGLVDNLTRGELIDVVRFLSELGKVGGNYTVGRDRVVRRWQALEATKEASERLRRDRIGSATQDHAAFTWSPRYSTVAGELPLGELPSMEQKWMGYVTLPKISVVRCELQILSSGKFALALNSPEGLSLWVDGQPIELANSIELDLSVGRHRLTWAINRNERNDTLRVEVRDVAGSTAQVQVVTGK